MTRPSARASTITLVGVLLAAGMPVSAQEALRLEPIVVSGDPAPGLPDAAFAEMDSAWMNRSGQVAFWARLAGDALTDLTDQSVWVADGGGLVRVAAAGEPAPGSTGRPLTAIGQVMMDDAGRVVMLGALDDGITPYGNRQAPMFTLFRVDGAAETLVAAENALLPSTLPPADPANRLVNWIISPAASDAGILAFDGWTDDGALTPWLPGALPLTLDGRMLSSRVRGQPVVGPGGHVVFRLAFTDVNPDSAHPDLVVNALMLDGPADPASLLFFTIAPEPLLPSVPFADVAQQVAMNAAGDIVFRARTRGDAGLHGIWMLSAGATTPIVQQGDAVPGAPGQRFGRFAGGPAMNLHGDVVVQAIAETADGSMRRQGLWSFPADEPAWEVARSGAPAPGAADAVYVHLTDATITEAGRAVFIAGVNGDSLGEFTQTALIVRSRDGGVTSLVRTGQEVTVSGVPGVVRGVAFAGGRNPDGSRQVRTYGAADQIVFDVLLEDERSALLRATIGLAADYDHNGVVDDLDLMTYVDLWYAAAARADLAGQETIDIFDLLAYLDCWFLGRSGGDCL